MVRAKLSFIGLLRGESIRELIGNQIIRTYSLIDIPASVRENDAKNFDIMNRVLKGEKGVFCRWLLIKE